MTTTRKPRSSRQKVTGSFKALTEGHKSGDLLLGDIREHLVLQNEKHKGDRRQDIIHPSEMAKSDWCPRSTAYRVSGLEPTNPPTALFHGIVSIFAEGHDRHSKIQGWLKDMGRLWGRWWCAKCETHRTLVGGICPICDSDMEYKEVPLDSRYHGIAGHADGGVLDLDAFIEIKTIGLGTLRIEEPELVKQYTKKCEDGTKVVDYDELFKGIKRPLKSHRKQAQVYLGLAKEMGINVNKMIFIYENKATQVMREFVIPYSESESGELLDKAREVWLAKNDPESIDRPTEEVKSGRTTKTQVVTKTSKVCKECVFRDHCYRNSASEEAGLPEDGGVEPRSEEATGSSEDSTGRPSRGRRPRSAEGSQRTQRPRSDDSVSADDGVGVVHGGSTRDRRSGRAVRRRESGEGEGDSNAGRIQREDRDRRESEGVGGPGVRRRPRPRSGESRV